MGDRLPQVAQRSLRLRIGDLCPPAISRRRDERTASYLEHGDADGPRDELHWTPEFSRRARGFSVYAALRSPGRQGVADLIDRCWPHARMFAELLRDDSAVEVLKMRISVCSWRTTSEDIERSAAAVLRVAGRTEMAASPNTDGPRAI